MGQSVATKKSTIVFVPGAANEFNFRPLVKVPYVGGSCAQRVKAASVNASESTQRNMVHPNRLNYAYETPCALRVLWMAVAFGEIENAVGSCGGIEEFCVAVGPADLNVLELHLVAEAEVETKVA